MLHVIEKLLILQDRDRHILRLRDELARLGPEREQFQTRQAATQGASESAKNTARQLESDRKKLELEVETKKQLIEKYSLQQFQTKKNEEYRALAHEIETCQAAIGQLDDQQLELMERIEAAQKVAAAAGQAAQEVKRDIDSLLAGLDAREKNLRREFDGLQANRGELAADVDESVLGKYERLLKQKGQNVVVGIQHGVCGGCHMQINRQVIVLCQGAQDIVPCPNCGRILYFTREMDLSVAE